MPGFCSVGHKLQFLLCCTQSYKLKIDQKWFNNTLKCTDVIWLLNMPLEGRTLASSALLEELLCCVHSLSAYSFLPHLFMLRNFSKMASHHKLRCVVTNFTQKLYIRRVDMTQVQWGLRLGSRTALSATCVMSSVCHALAPSGHPASYRHTWSLSLLSINKLSN